jgi:dsDNA-specific endonuclease/ATPase MutS2
MFQAGDLVSFLNEKGTARIVRVLNKQKVEIITEEGMIMESTLKELVKAHPQANYEITVPKKLKTTDKNPPKHQKKIKDHKLIDEVDLHIEELVDNTKGMNNSAILNIQLNHFRLKLEQAMAANALRIIFIHGIGNGKLRSEIHRILTSYDNIRFQDASYRKYGFGATEVILK